MSSDDEADEGDHHGHERHQPTDRLQPDRHPGSAGFADTGRIDQLFRIANSYRGCQHSRHHDQGANGDADDGHEPKPAPATHVTGREQHQWGDENERPRQNREPHRKPGRHRTARQRTRIIDQRLEGPPRSKEGGHPDGAASEKQPTDQQLRLPSPDGPTQKSERNERDSESPTVAVSRKVACTQRSNHPGNAQCHCTGEQSMPNPRTSHLFTFDQLDNKHKGSVSRGRCDKPVTASRCVISGIGRIVADTPFATRRNPS